MQLNNPNIFQIKNNKNFQDLQKIILKAFIRKKNFPIDYKILNKKIKKINQKDLRGNNKLMIRVEALLLNILKDLKIKNIKSLQYPVNIRMTENKNFPKKLRDFDTRHVHCDYWSGAPIDSFNSFIYLFACEKAPKLEIYKNLPKKHQYRNLFGKYSDFKIEKKYLKKIKFKAEAGSMAIWETFTPHKTKITKNLNQNYYRISIDFRFKKKSPYNRVFIKEHNNRQHLMDYSKKKYTPENFHKTKMSHDGVYWSVDKNYNSFKNIKNKIKFEMSMVKKNNFLYNLRKKYIKKFY